MTAKTQDEILGFEYDWLACDGDGHVAIFTTAGGSPAPEEFLRDTDAHQRAIEATLALRPLTVAVFAPMLNPGLDNTWLELAERGLFGFDGDPNGGPYAKVAAPLRPVHVDDLPPEAVAVARRLVFPQLIFSAVDRVAPEELGKFEGLSGNPIHRRTSRLSRPRGPRAWGTTLSLVAEAVVVHGGASVKVADFGRPEDVCASMGTQPVPPRHQDRVGLSQSARTDLPIHGLRTLPGAGSSGWYIWAGEWSDADDFFESTHVAHLPDVCPLALVFLSLPPGWRFLSDGDYIDVWFDPELLAPSTQEPHDT